MKVYLAGPMRVTPDGVNGKEFAQYAKVLRDQGHEVFSPPENDQPGEGPRSYFERDLTWICRHAEAIALLPNWWHSPGARTERSLAQALGIEVFELKEKDLYANL